MEDYLALATPTIWQVVSGYDRYGQRIMHDPQTIPARWDWARSVVANAEGEQVTSEAKVIVVAAVTPDDLLTDPSGRAWAVISTHSYSDLDGNEEFRECYL